MSILKTGICALLTKPIIESLCRIGVRTTVDFITTNPEDLAKKCCISYKDLITIREVLLTFTSSFPLKGGDLYNNTVKSAAILSTGCESLDSLLDGGIYSGEVTEIAGQVAAGKTQLCFSAAVSVAHCNKQNVVFIDTCGSFSVERLIEFITPSTEDIESTLTRLKCIRIFDAMELLGILEDLKQELMKENDSFYSNVKLVVCDSVATVIYPVLGGQQLDGQAIMSQIGQKLKILAVECSVAVLITNNTVGGDSVNPGISLGRTWSHIPHTRILIQPAGDESYTDTGLRHIRLIKSSRQAIRSSIQVKITDNGIESLVMS